MDATQTLLLIHIYLEGLPMLGVSIFLLVITIRIRSYLGRYAIQRTLFRGILLAGYLFILIAVMHLVEHVLDWYGYELLSLEVAAIWHAGTLIVLLIVAYSFYQYLRVLSSAEEINLIGER